MRTLATMVMIGGLVGGAVHAQLDQLDLNNPDASCGHILYFDFNSVIDGGCAYHNLKTGATCNGCSNAQVLPGEQKEACPPAEWTCPEPDAGAIFDARKAKKMNSDVNIIK